MPRGGGEGGEECLHACCPLHAWEARPRASSPSSLHLLHQSPSRLREQVEARLCLMLLLPAAGCWLPAWPAEAIHLLAGHHASPPPRDPPADNAAALMD